MSHQRFRLLCIGALSVLLFATGHSFAEDGGDGELARDLSVQGIAAQQRGDHSAALAYFERAQRELDHAKIRYFRAKSLDATARYDQALQLFKGVVDDEENLKYALEARAYIRAITAERETARLMARVAELERSCGQQVPQPVKVQPSVGP